MVQYIEPDPNADGYGPDRGHVSDAVPIIGGLFFLGLIVFLFWVFWPYL